MPSATVRATGQAWPCSKRRGRAVFDADDVAEIIGPKDSDQDLRKTYATALLDGIKAGTNTPGCNEMELAGAALTQVFAQAKVDGDAQYELGHAFGQVLDSPGGAGR